MQDYVESKYKCLYKDNEDRNSELNKQKEKREVVKSFLIKLKEENKEELRFDMIDVNWGLRRIDFKIWMISTLVLHVLIFCLKPIF